jgi:phosphoribosylaminoimidazolecarboxamide formyltransferase/IMP cyclohydrolase
MSDVLPIRTALLSVSDKTNLMEFARQLHLDGVRIISTGGTAQTLKEAGIPVVLVSEITECPEMMEGRVKTLHPKIHGAILGRRDEHAQEAAQYNIQWIDLVVVNLYPFQETVNRCAESQEIIEQIDIGGPAMLRAGAKNFQWVTTVHDPADYEIVLAELKSGGVSLNTRKKLAAKVFAHVAAYDAAIARYLQNDIPLIEQDLCVLPLQRIETLRYGENPHQAAALFSLPWEQGLAKAELIQGKALSYNNLSDAEAALRCVQEFSEPAAVIVKHANPCGAAIADSITVAYQQAFAADSESAFGGIVALNRVCTSDIAEKITAIFMEVLIAPDFDPEALIILAKKPNLRVIRMPQIETIVTPWQFRTISGGFLIQETDTHVLDVNSLECVTARTPSSEELSELLFAWKLAKHLKSNAIAICKTGRSIGLSGGQVSRIAALQLALGRGKEHLMGSVLASDAFFPFRDSIDALQGSGIKAIIQPGGSIRDQEVITACNEWDIAMVFTGIRCFNH